MRVREPRRSVGEPDGKPKSLRISEIQGDSGGSVSQCMDEIKGNELDAAVEGACQWWP
jgi:hypothetical protein